LEDKTVSTLPYDEVRQKIEAAERITVLSHINPDADALGTALGIYHLLFANHKGKKIEVVNASKVLPRYLDFLPHFKKIKHKMDHKEGLVITCDSGSLDRLGYEVGGRELINIDHHQSNTNYGTVNIVLPKLASSSQVAYLLFKELYISMCLHRPVFIPRYSPILATLPLQVSLRRYWMSPKHW